MKSCAAFVGPPLLESFMEYAGLSREDAEKAVEYYRERYNTTGIYENRLYPKIRELLELLKVNDKILGVASSKPEVYVRKILEYFKVDEYFQVIVGSELDGRRTGKARGHRRSSPASGSELAERQRADGGVTASMT